MKREEYGKGGVRDGYGFYMLSRPDTACWFGPISIEILLDPDLPPFRAPMHIHTCTQISCTSPLLLKTDMVPGLIRTLQLSLQPITSQGFNRGNIYL
jgi:hypothetical protein